MSEPGALGVVDTLGGSRPSMRAALGSALATRALPVLSAVVGALLFTAACPPHEWALAAWFAPALFLLPLRRLSPLAAAGCGLVFGTVWGCTMAGWMGSASLVYFDFSRLLATGFVFAVAFGYAGIPNALLGAAYAFAWPRVRPGARVAVGAWLWVASEVLRAHIFTGLPWELLGHTQFRSLALIQIADLGGAYAVSFVVAFVSLALGGLAIGWRRDRRWARVHHLVAPVLLLGWALGYGAWAQARYADTLGDTPHTVAVIQGNVGNSFRWRREFFERTLLTYTGLTRTAGRQQPTLVVWPENAVNFFLDREPTLAPILRSAAANAREGLIVGGPRRESADVAYNSAYLLDAKGRVAGAYDKQHLLPFAEYNPLRSTRDPLAGPIIFTPASGAALLETASLRIGAMICYEILFPGLVRDLVQRGAGILVNIANDSWLDDGDGAAPAQHFSMVAFRAVETRRYLVRASSSGISGFVGPDGAAFGLIPRATSGTSLGMVAARDELTPYVRWGDLWVLVTGLLCCTAVRRRRQGHA